MSLSSGYTRGDLQHWCPSWCRAALQLDECLGLRQDLTGIQERQDFTERALSHDPVQARLAPSEAPPKRLVTRQARSAGLYR